MQKVHAISSLRSQSGLGCVPSGVNLTISWAAEDGADDCGARHQIAIGGVDFRSGHVGDERDARAAGSAHPKRL